jgi:pyruvate kinase
MLAHQMDVVRFNFSWSNIEERSLQIATIRRLEEEFKRRVPMIQDLPGPRIQQDAEHTYDRTSSGALTEHDRTLLKFGIQNDMDYVALSFVSSARDVEECRREIVRQGGTQHIIAKIERREALDHVDEILQVADAIMIARGDLGNEVPLEQIPFIQADLIAKANQVHKPVIVATQMLTSMVASPVPTRAEVTDVAHAILWGADAVMLSEETSIGKYPIETVAMMERVVVEAERHKPKGVCINSLTTLSHD